MLNSGTSELFATCSQNDIRVWHTESSKELLRIMVPNITCNALGFMQDGRSIFSGQSHTGGLLIYALEMLQMVKCELY